MVTYTESIASIVLSHPWKYRPRTRAVRGILWHITGSATQKRSWQEYADTRTNWFANPNNRVVHPPYDPYAGISSILAGPGMVCEVVPYDRFIPAFSSHPADETAVSIEVALPNVTALVSDPDGPLLIATCVRLGRELRAEFGIRHERVFPYRDAPNDWDWTGEAGHSDTRQGRASGRVDPGEIWWAEYLRATAAEEELPVNALERLERLERVVASDMIVACDAGNAGALAKALTQVPVIGQRYGLTTEQALVFADAQGMRFWLGLQQTQERVGALESGR